MNHVILASRFSGYSRPGRLAKCLPLPLLFLMAAAISWRPARAQTADATSLNNKIMAGYQGWFRTPGDQAGNTGWAHWFNAAVPSAARLAFDTWPDMREMDADEKVAVPGFSYPDGKQAYLYSAQHPKTVLRHFTWMKQAGIDGVWLSEFCSHMPGGRQQRDSAGMLTIMENVRQAARATGRTWAFMYDFSGLKPDEMFRIIVGQWKRMVDSGVTSDKRYLHHNGKPVLLLWGFFPNRPQAAPEVCKPLIAFLQAPGKYQATLVGGGDPNWRSEGSPEFQKMLMSMTAWQPWSVGRVTRDPASGYKESNTALWAGDMAVCKAHHVLFIPVFNAGTHIAGPPPVKGQFPIVPRRNGNFLWHQFVEASKAGGINSVFIAMFDEVNEGTEIMKVTNRPPTQADFLTYEGSTPDWYMRLAACGEQLLRTGHAITQNIPISPFDPHGWYRLKNKETGLFLSSKASESAGLSLVSSKATLPADKDHHEQWQLKYDGAGYFSFKNRATGKWMRIDDKGLNIVQVAAARLPADPLKWHLEWDGTGDCRLISKSSGKSVGADLDENSGHASARPVEDAATDNLRWQVIPISSE